MTEEQDFFAEKQSGNSVKNILVKYLSYWPFFILSLIVCVGAGVGYIRYATPKYMATASVLVKDEPNSSGGSTSKSGSSDDLIRSALTGEKQTNIDNEVKLMKSQDLLKKVVQKNKFNIFYYKIGKVKNVNVYADVPFELEPVSIIDSISAVAVTIKDISEHEVTVLNGAEKDAVAQKVKWFDSVKIKGNTFRIKRIAQNLDPLDAFSVVWKPVAEVAGDIGAFLNVDVPDKKTSIIQLKIVTENLKMGTAILNAIIAQFNATDLEEKNRASQNTIAFIEKRLDIVAHELSGVEGNLENFQGANQLVNVDNQTTQSFENSNEAAKSINSIRVQLLQVEQIQNYFNNPGSADKLVVSNLGITDPTLTTYISQFNELQLKKEREAPLLASKSIFLKDYDDQIQSVKSNIIQSLRNITENLRMQESKIQKQSEQYSQFLSALPHKERTMQEIKRKQSISESIYLYLLQKREETEISSESSRIPIYRQIDTASGYGPVEPSKANIIMFSFMMGLLLPIGFVYLNDLLNEKITDRSDVVSKVKAPVIGEISHVDASKSKFILDSGRDLLGEEFRILRTNLSFLLNKNAKNCVMVTSSNMGEGKSFVSSNVALAFAIPGKKVALLELDARKPQIAKNFELDNSKGLTQYLSGEENDLSKLYQTVSLPNLHIYTSGPTLMNPADLLLAEKVPQLFETLKQEYELIVIDSPPVGLVTDALIVAEYSNAVVYVVRQRYTLKKQLDIIKDFYKTGKFRNVGLVINDIKSGGKYGDGHRYGLNYNYAYGEEVKKSFIKKLLPF